MHIPGTHFQTYKILTRKKIKYQPCQNMRTIFPAIIRVHWDEGGRRELLDDDSDTDGAIGHAAVNQVPVGWSIQLTTCVLNSNLHRTFQIIKFGSVCFWTLVLSGFLLSLQTYTIIYLKLGHDHFLPHPFCSLFTKHSVLYSLSSDMKCITKKYIWFCSTSFEF